MNGSLRLIILCLAGTSLTAQADYSPSSIYSNREGEGTAGGFGAYADARVQLADASLRGRRRVVTSISFRLDYHNYEVRGGMGRQWRDVSLSMSEFAMARMTRDPNANVTGTTTLVLSGPRSWPTQRGLPSARPTGQEIRLPFTTAWVYSGSQDILADYTFRGGQLANGGPMGYSPLGPESPYYLDAAFPGSTVPRYGMPFGDIWPGGCNDSGSRFPEVATLHLQARHYRATATLPNRFDLLVHGKTGVQTNVITALGLGLNPTGTVIPGVTCQRLFRRPLRPDRVLLRRDEPHDGIHILPLAQRTQPDSDPGGPRRRAAGGAVGVE